MADKELIYNGKSDKNWYDFLFTKHEVPRWAKSTAKVVGLSSLALMFATLYDGCQGNSKVYNSIFNKDLVAKFDSVIVANENLAEEKDKYKGQSRIWELTTHNLLRKDTLQLKEATKANPKIKITYTENGKLGVDSTYTNNSFEVSKYYPVCVKAEVGEGEKIKENNFKVSNTIRKNKGYESNVGGYRR